MTVARQGKGRVLRRMHMRNFPPYSLVKEIGRQTTLPKLLRRGDVRRPLSGRFRPFLAPLQDAQHLKQAQFFTV